MYCQNCGFAVADGARFCESCGTPRSPRPVLNRTPSQIVNQQTPPKSHIALAAVIGAAILVGVIAILIRRIPSEASRAGDKGQANPDKMTRVVIDGGESLDGWAIGTTKMCNWHVNAADFREFLICPPGSVASENEIVISDSTPDLLISYPEALGPSSRLVLRCVRYPDRGSDHYVDCH